MGGEFCHDTWKRARQESESCPFPTNFPEHKHKSSHPPLAIDTRRLPTRVKSEYGVGGTVRRQLRVNIICIVLSIVENSIFTHLSPPITFPQFLYRGQVMSHHFQQAALFPGFLSHSKRSRVPSHTHTRKHIPMHTSEIFNSCFTNEIILSKHD